MERDQVKALLSAVQSGSIGIDDAVERIRTLPFERIDHIATLDHHRELRSGIPEVVLGEHKRAEDIARLLLALSGGGGGALATRVEAAKAKEVLAAVTGARYHQRARIIEVVPAAQKPVTGGDIAVVSAGTSDLPVADEAAITCAFLGHEPLRIDDIGVAGLPRTLAASEKLRDARVVIAVAGMEGALPGVLAGLIPAPIVAVPTSIGYGVGAGGLAAVLTMLATCAPGVSVVNIDNGFGAAVCAVRALGRA
ncbi:MAG TPA: nickel pincer cofactor biosynthesis protein LarB [Kofleriaceae bacterium]|nr:nickel pincer cofactor biosynthesis protein LarB [Kofleriaceae bacterium]